MSVTAPSNRTTAIGLWLVLAIVAWWSFFQVADLMLSGAAETWNIAVMQAVPAWQTAWLSPIVIGLTQFGSVVGLTVVGLAAVAYLRRREQPQEAFVTALLLVGTAIWTFGLKDVYRHPRPQVFLPLVHESGFSFPSGHSLAGWGFYGYVALWSRRNDERLIGVTAAALAVILPLSRLYLGVHWPTDVLAGLCLGTFWLSLCEALRLSRRPA